MLFLTPNQQSQSNEGNNIPVAENTGWVGEGAIFDKYLTTSTSETIVTETRPEQIIIQ